MVVGPALSGQRRAVLSVAIQASRWLCDARSLGLCLHLARGLISEELQLGRSGSAIVLSRPFFARTSFWCLLFCVVCCDGLERCVAFPLACVCD